MPSASDALKLIGAILGIFSFSWNVWSALRSYLKLDIAISNFNANSAVAKVSVTNSAFTSKQISFAALIISSERLTLVEAASRLDVSNTKHHGDSRGLVHLYKTAAETPLVREDCRLVPLRELYKEQAMVGPGETVSHVCPLDLSTFARGSIQVVRFIVFVSYFGLYLRWRYTSDALMVPLAETSRGEEIC
jgi:hypothetical protein